MRLNLGCGSDYKKGYINVDIDPKVRPDKVADLINPLPFKDSSSDEILIQDVLEHLTKEQAEGLIKNCHRVLKSEGDLKLRVPYVKNIIEKYGHDEEVMVEFIYGSTKENGDWGAHKYGYTKKTLKILLKRSNFRDIKILADDTNLMASARKENLKIKPKVMVIQQTPDWGGAEEWMSLLVGRLVKLGIQVEGNSNLEELRIRWKKDGVSRVGNLPFVLDIIGDYKGLLKALIFLIPATLHYFKTLKAGKKRGINLILMSGFGEKLLVSWIAWLLKIQVVWYDYADLTSIFKRNWRLPEILYKVTNFIPARIITLSNYSRNKLLPGANISLSKMRLIRPGVEIPNVIEPKNNLVVGSLSRLSQDKGQRLLIQAFKKVVEIIPRAKLKIAGRGPDSEYLEQMIERLGLSKSVKLVGFVEKDKFYKSLDIFTFSSIWPLEGFGMVMIEAMSYGLPIVAINKNAVPEVVSRDNGYLVNKISASSLAAKIVYALKDKERRKLGIKGRENVLANFNLKFNTDIVISELYDVVAEARR